MANMEIRCKKCRSKFIFTKGEQQFYAEKGLNIPKTCPSCRGINNKSSGNNHKRPNKYGCPICGNADPKMLSYGTKAYLREDMKCHACGYEWNPKKDHLK